MDKFLFTDGTNGVREAQSTEELESWIKNAADPGKIRIWQFNTNEWISYAAYKALAPQVSRKESIVVADPPSPVSSVSRSGWLKKTMYLVAAAAGIFLVFNFTKVKWERADPVSNAADRPKNVPVMDIDSLVAAIEEDRGQLLDRSTRTNLRLRNTWPERILLQVNADRETNGNTARFFNVSVSVDNTTGFTLDKAVAKLVIWKDGKEQMSDTFHFKPVRFDQPAKRNLDFRYKGDSISVSFETIRAKAFNFCYSAATKNNSGNYNDRWFCRE
jgi:hypothetical protein